MTSSPTSSSSSSLPSSAPSPRIRYFDLLPPELLSHVISYIDTLPRRDAKERQSALYSLCLTSKLLHELSQHLLLKHVDTLLGAGHETLALLVERTPAESIAMVHTLCLGGKDVKHDRLVGMARNLQEVCIYGQFSILPSLSGTNITTLSLYQVVLQSATRKIFLPQLVNLSLYKCAITDSNVLSVPRLKHLVWLPWDWDSTADEMQFVDQVALTLVSLSMHFEEITSIPRSIYSSSVSLFFPTYCSSPVPVTLDGFMSVRISIPNDDPLYITREFSEARGRLERWTKMVSWWNAQVEAIYFAIVVGEGGGGSKVHPEIEEYVEALEAACQRKKIPVFWEVGTVEEETFSDFVPASFVKISEARVMAARGSTG